MVVSVFAANSVAASTDQKARNSFDASSKEIASTLQLALQRADDLAFSAKAYVVANPDATNTEFRQWVQSEQAADRYPELEGLGLLSVVPKEQVPAFAARVEADPPKALPNGKYQIVPPGDRPVYCLISFDWHRTASVAPAGTDYCAKSADGPSRLRDSGVPSYGPYKIGDVTILVVQRSVYAGGLVPATVEERRNTFIGALGMTYVPSVLLDAALRAHPDTAVELRYKNDATDTNSPYAPDAVFTSGDTGKTGFTDTIDLHNGWTVKTVGNPRDGGLLGNGGALGLLIVGFALSLSLGVLVFVLATSRRRALMLVDKQTEEIREQARQIELSGRKFRSLVQNSSDLTVVCDAEGTVTYVSATSERVIGMDESRLLDTSVADLFRADYWQSLALWLDEHNGAPLVLACCIEVDGHQRWVEATATDLRNDPSVNGVVLNIRDITDRHRLEIELRHAQKLETVGQLSAGIAHEINTPIQFIGDNVRFVQEGFGDLVQLLEAYRDIRQGTNVEQANAIVSETDTSYLMEEMPTAINDTLGGIDRVAVIVRAMKAFGHPGTDRAEPADLNEAVRTTLVVANSQISDIASVVTELGDLPLVSCHVGDVNQVLLNLVINAAHAIAANPRADGALGTITVRSRLDGDDAVVEVNDTGCGIPSEIADRVFDPFFTTKTIGSGTGQGLSVAHSLICDRHQGTITFTSAVGVGTTFIVRLPVKGSGAAATSEHAAEIGYTTASS